MKPSEHGFTLIELLIATAIVALIAGAAGAATLQLFASTKRSNDHMTAVRQVQNAGYWISRDALMAENVVIGDDPETEELLEFLTLTWTEWDFEAVSTYHSVIYSFDLSGEIGKLIRTHSSDEPDVQTLVAEYIYYDPGEPGTTEATYDSSVLTVQIAAAIGEAKEVKEYRVWRRPNF